MVFSGYSVSSTNKSDYHDIAQILLKVALSTITLTLPPKYTVEIPSSTSKNNYIRSQINLFNDKK